MLASGAHVKIGTQEFRLKRAEDSYSYALIPIEEQVQYWLWDDWSGGEGYDAYDSADPIVYHQGNCNPRRPGLLTNPPLRDQNNVTPTEAPNTSLMAAAGGKLFIQSASVVSQTTETTYTTDLTTFNRLHWSATDWNTAVDTITAIASDGNDVFLFGHDSSGNTGSQMKRINGNTPTAVATNVWAFDTGRTTPIIGAATLDGRIYGWMGHNLLNWKNNSASDPVDDNLSYNTGSSSPVGTFRTDYWGGIVAADTSLFFFYAVDGQTTVYEFDGRSGSPVWPMPSGFTGKGIVYSNGAILVCGDYNGKAALFGMSVISRQPLFLGYIREDDTVNLEIMGAGFGSEILMAEKNIASTGKIFIYDLGMDAFSELDELTMSGYELYSLGTFKGKRVAATENGTAQRVIDWELDTVSSTDVAGRMETGAWDMDLPEEDKVLEGIHVLAKLDGASDTIDVYYMDNEDGTWTQAGAQLTSGFHNYIEVSNGTTDVNFRTLRLRADPAVGAEIYAISARYRVSTYLEVWELALDLSDEVGGRWARKSSTSDKAHALRDYIRDIADNKATVTFLDGARYPGNKGADPDKYSTHQVKVSIPVDNITNVDTGEGTMVVRLVSTDTN